MISTDFGHLGSVLHVLQVFSPNETRCASWLGLIEAALVFIFCLIVFRKKRLKMHSGKGY